MAITVAFRASWRPPSAAPARLLVELAALVTVMLLGHWMEMRAIGQAQGAVAALAELLPDQAERVTDDGTEQVAVSELAGRRRRAGPPRRPDPRRRRDRGGAAELDESMITGESRPVAGPKASESSPGPSPSTAPSGSVRRWVTTPPWPESTPRGPGAGVEVAGASAGGPSGGLLFYVALGAAVVTAVGWLLVSRPDEAVSRTVAVLVIACPHALGLAIPLVIAISTSLAARNGILLKDRLALERMRNVDVVLFDKTGTLTSATHRLTSIYTRRGDDDRVLALAAAVEAESEHPVARAVVEASSWVAYRLPRIPGHERERSQAVTDRICVAGRSSPKGASKFPRT